MPARAKLNLDLAVLARNDDGFHEVRTRLQAVALHDLLEMDRADRTTMTTSGQHALDPDNNSVRKAHKALQDETGSELPTTFHLDKRIPPGSGMGGASSDAAAALKGLVELHGIKTNLSKIAAGIGADVPFFLTGGAAMAEGRGERLTAVPTESAWFAIAWPNIELSTAAVYRAWDEAKGGGQNQLMEAAFHVEPRVKEFSARLGPNWQMTGSGSAFFQKCTDERAAREATARLECWTVVTWAIGAWA